MSRLVDIIIFCLALIVGIVLVVHLCEGDYYYVLVAGGGLLMIMFTPFLVSWFWAIGTFFCAMAYEFYLTGFPVGQLEIASVFGFYAFFFALTLRRSSIAIPRENRPTLLRFSGALFLLYLMIHFFWFAPHAGPGALKSIVREYSKYALPILLMLCFTQRVPANLKARRPLVVIAWLIGLSDVLNVGGRFWQTFHYVGFGDPTGIPALVIPGLYAVENVYALRSYGPALALACMILICFRTSPLGVLKRTLLIIGIAISIVGPLFSGGRFSVLVSLFFMLLILMISRRYIIVMVTVLIGVLGVLSLNMFKNQLIEHAPPLMMRSLAMLIIDKSYARASIDSSTEWRQELFLRAIQEWKSSNSTMAFGRSIKAFNFNYDAAVENGMGEEGMEISLARVGTHSLVSDLLLAFGLAGAAFFFFFQAVILYTITRQWTSPNLGPPFKEFALFLLVLYAYSLLYALIAGPIDPLPQFLLSCLFYFRGNQVEKAVPPASELSHPWPV